MASEIKVDTISEKTSANGVTIDGVNIKDSALATAGSVPLSTIDIDGGTDIGAAIVDADLFIIDDGAGGTNRKTTASRLKTYAGTTINNATANEIVTIASTTTELDAEANLTFSGSALQCTATLTVGVDDTGHDVKFFGATASSHMLWDESADDLNLIASGLGVTTAKDLGAGIHIRTSDTGASVHANADELVIEQEGHAGMTILSADASLGSIMFGDSGSNVDGGITYDHNTLEMAFQTGNGGEVFRLSNDGQLSTRGETAPDVDNGGATLNHGGDDGAIMTFKNSDVAHGITGHYETDTYGIITKKSNSQGGFMLRGYSETGVGFEIKTVMGNGEGSTAKSTSADGNMQIDGYQHDGSAGGQAMPSNTNIVAWKNATDTQVIFDIEGEIHSNGGAQSAYDEYDDAQLIRTFDLSRGRGTIDSKFDKFIAYNHEHLAEMKLVGREDDGTPNHFINVTGFQRLHNGAIWQQYEKHQQLLEAVYDLAKEAVGKEKADAILEKHEVKRLQ